MLLETALAKFGLKLYTTLKLNICLHCCSKKTTFYGELLSPKTHLQTYKTENLTAMIEER